MFFIVNLLCFAVVSRAWTVFRSCFTSGAGTDNTLFVLPLYLLLTGEARLHGQATAAVAARVQNGAHCRRAAGSGRRWHHFRCVPFTSSRVFMCVCVCVCGVFVHVTRRRSYSDSRLTCVRTGCFCALISVIAYCRLLYYKGKYH